MAVGSCRSDIYYQGFVLAMCAIVIVSIHVTPLDSFQRCQGSKFGICAAEVCSRRPTVTEFYIFTIELPVVKSIASSAAARYPFFNFCEMSVISTQFTARYMRIRCIKSRITFCNLAMEKSGYCRHATIGKSDLWYETSEINARPTAVLAESTSAEGTLSNCTLLQR